jgi:predicted enzyme related to lactoylglutathione lyase
MRYAHTNIISHDWRNLAKFYQDVFDCRPVPPVRSQTGEWLDKATGVANAALEGVHLRLPGYGDQGPTLEIYSYQRMEEKPPSVANRKGFGHIAFEVNDVPGVLERLLAAGGRPVGTLVENEVPGVGIITVVYAADPEGNIIELQSWKLAC